MTVPWSAKRTMLRATSDTAVASRVRSVPVKPARTAISRAACRAATMSGSPVIATRTSSSRTGPRSSRGSLSRAQSSHSRRCWAASTSRWRRRSALDRASSTGRHRSVGGSTFSRASRYSTRSLARVRLSCAATAPAVLPETSARALVASPSTSWASRMRRSLSSRRCTARAIAALSSEAMTTLVAPARARPGHGRDAGCAARGPPAATWWPSRCARSRWRRARPCPARSGPGRPARAPASPARGPRQRGGDPPGRPTIRRSMGIRSATSPT